MEEESGSGEAGEEASPTPTPVIFILEDRNADATETTSQEKGGMRYNLRPTIRDADRYAPGAINVGYSEINAAAVCIELPGHNGAPGQVNFSAKEMKVPKAW